MIFPSLRHVKSSITSQYFTTFLEFCYLALKEAVVITLIVSDDGKICLSALTFCLSISCLMSNWIKGKDVIGKLFP